MSYSELVGPERPGCVVLLLDQSYSMNEPVAGGSGESKADALAVAANGVLVELIRRSVADRASGPRHLYDVATIGYGSDVGPAWGGELTGRGLVPIDEIARRPARVAEQTSRTGRANRRPVWIEPVADGATPLCEAMNRAGQLIAPWIASHPTSFPPIVINVGDGAATDGDPLVWSRRLRSLDTDDGETLMFNINVSALAGQPVVCPSSADGLDDEFAHALFEMSSALPDPVRAAAASGGRALDEGARGLVFHADTTTLMSSLRLGVAAPTADVSADPTRAHPTADHTQGADTR